jgi:hypothetical protein
MKTRRWRKLTTNQRRALLAGGTVQLVLLGAALVDIGRRPSAELLGGRRLWVPAVFVNFIGPLAYFLIGRKR